MSTAAPSNIACQVKIHPLINVQSRVGSLWVVTNDLDSSSYNSHVSYNSQLEDWSAP